MENLKQKIQTDIIQSLKKKDETTRSTLRILLTAILNKEKEKRYEISKKEPDLNEEKLIKKANLTDGEIIEVISTEAKKRKEAISEFSAYQPTADQPKVGGGPAEGWKKNKIKNKLKDFINKERAELEILENYLPEQLSEDEIKKIAKEATEKTGAKEIKDIGRIMAEIMPKVKGRAEGGIVSRIVKELLSSGPKKI